MAYAVTYAANGATSGAVPVDATAYAGGETVTVLGNSGALARTDYTFAGWNTVADGSGFSRLPAATFLMPAANVTLYAQWSLGGLVPLSTWKSYAKKAEEDVAGELLNQAILSSAEEIVKEYLGYDPALQTYTAERYEGKGGPSLVLKAKPITALSAVTVDGAARTVGDFIIEGERITDKNGLEFPAGSEILVTFTAGLAAGDSRLTLIMLTIMDIASLLSMNRGDNIGVSSVSLDGGNTRSFVNYNNFSKQLSRLSNLKLARLP